MATGALSIPWFSQYLSDNSILSVIVKLLTDDAGYGEAVKLFYVQWIGPQVSAVEIARARELFPSVQAFVHRITPLTGELEARTYEDVTREALLARVR